MLSGGISLHDHEVLKTWTPATGFFPPHQLGTFGVTKDGRGYRYSRAGAVALNKGQLHVAATQAANHENCVVTAGAANQNQVTLTLGATAVTANQYAGGFLVINDNTGEGTAYGISGHPAANASASLTITLLQNIAVALSASTTEASLVLNPWADVVISVTDQLDMPVGVPNVGVAAGSYFWAQTRGVASVLADEALAVGVALTTGTGTAGAVEALDAAGEPQVGVALQAGVDTEYRACYLQID